MCVYFSFTVYVEYGFEFRNPFLAAHFINFSYIHFRAKTSPPKLTELLRLCLWGMELFAFYLGDGRMFNSFIGAVQSIVLSVYVC